MTRQNLFTGGMSSPDIICLQGQCFITRHNLFTGDFITGQSVYRGNVIIRHNLFTGGMSSLDKIC